MKKFARPIALLAALVLLASLLAACGGAASSAPAAGSAAQSGSGSAATPAPEENANLNAEGLPIVNETVTLKAMVLRTADHSMPFDELPVVKAFEEETNIHIEWIEIPQESAKERVNLAFSSGDLPDFFYGINIGYDTMLRNANEGAILPLDDLIAEHAPNLTKRFGERPDFHENLKFPDGKIYGIPKVDEKPLMSNQDNFFINKKWLDELGLPVPTTTEEFYEALKAFKGADLNGNGENDEIPFSCIVSSSANGLGYNNASDIQSLFGSFGVVDTPADGTHLMVKDGSLLFVPTSDEYRAGLEYLHMLYSEGLIDTEVFTQNTQQYRGKVGSDQVGAFMAWQLEDMVAAESIDDYIHLLPLKGEDGSQIWYRTPGVPGLDIVAQDTKMFAVTNKNEHLAETMRWFDYVTTDMNNVRMYYGTEGEGWHWTDEGLWEKLLDPSGNMTSTQFNCTMAVGPQAPTLLTYDDLISKQVTSVAASNKNAREAEYSQFYPEEELPQFKLTQDELDKISRQSIDMKTTVDNMKAKFITEGVTDETWSAYVTQVEGLGLADYMAVYEAAFARTK